MVWKQLEMNLKKFNTLIINESYHKKYNNAFRGTDGNETQGGHNKIPKIKIQFSCLSLTNFNILWIKYIWSEKQIPLRHINILGK